MRVLVVDDEADIRDSLQELFQDEGFAVTTAANGSEALDSLRGEQLPCVVILDLLMPGLDGNEVYETMQRDPRLAKIPVIVSTSDPSRAPSGVLIMKKPVNIVRLLGTVRQYCEPARALQPAVRRNAG
jgi:two-component system, sensor histidine kinase and response regulator